MTHNKYFFKKKKKKRKARVVSFKGISEPKDEWKNFFRPKR